MKQRVITVFGETEKGTFETFYTIQSLDEAFEKLGSPLPNTEALQFSLQILGAHQPILFYRVPEEGFSFDAYAKGLHEIRDHPDSYPIQALFMPGLSDPKLIDEAKQLCEMQKAILLITDKDFQDYKYS